MMMDGWSFGPSMMWMKWLAGLIFWGGIIVFGVWAVRRFTDRRSASDPRRILGERFARGEIDDEEFQRRLRVLRGSEP
jgi:putative membrane protein